jgi:hypothetical protein
MSKSHVNQAQLEELLYQALETEMGGVEVYRTALGCTSNEELAEEWQCYLEQTEQHVAMLRDVFDVLDLDADAETPGRAIVRHIGEALVKAMEMALETGPRAATELVAAECVVHAETRDHLNWELIGTTLKEGSLPDELRDALEDAHEKIEEQEDEHLYHTAGWTRELWIQSLGLPAVLPPPEEAREVKSAIAAARAKKARKEFL